MQPTGAGIPETTDIAIASDPQRRTDDQRAILLRVAWMAIALGLLVECIVLLIRATSGTLPGGATVLNEALQTVSWPFLVCIGVAFGAAVIAPSSTPSPAAPVSRSLALSGLLAAPAAFLIVRLLHKGTGAALGAAGSELGLVAILLLGLIKACEYGLLGAALERLKSGSAPTARGYAIGGLAIGLSFGSAALLVTSLAASPAPTTVKMITQGINEVVVPVGCALILYASGVLGKRVPL